MNRKAAASVHIRGYYVRQLERLEQQLQCRLREWRSLAEQNSSLRRKEELLFKSISTLGENLHFSALAAALELNRDISHEPCSREIAECLAQDLQVYLLLQSVSKAELSGVLAAESYTAHVLKGALTPERINEIRAASQETHLQVFRDLTMRLAFYLMRHNQQQQRVAEELAAQRQREISQKYKRIRKQLAQEAAQQQQQRQQTQSQSLQQSPEQQKQQPSQASQLQGSKDKTACVPPGLRDVGLCSILESIIDEYSRYIMLVSMTNYKGIQRMCYYNLESLERATPPNGYWRDVMLEMGLSPGQLEQIRDAYEHYSTRMCPLFARAQELGEQVRQLLLSVDMASSGSTPSSSSFTDTDMHNASVTSQQPQQHDREHSPQLPLQSSAAAAAAACAAQPQNPQQQWLEQQLHVQEQQLHQLHLQQQQHKLQKLHQDQEQQPMELSDTPAAADDEQAPAAESVATPQRNGTCDKDNECCGTNRLQQEPKESANISGSTSTGSIKPWQEFGLASSGLGVEMVDKLSVLLTELEHNCNSMSQLSHGLTFPVWNMFDRLQLTKMVVASYPFLPNICQICNAVYWDVTDSGAGK